MQNKLMAAFIIASCAGTASFWLMSYNYAQIKPQDVDPGKAYCTYDENSHKFRIVDASSRKSLIERTMPYALFGGPGPLTMKDGPTYASGTIYTVRPASQTCLVKDFYGKKKRIYKLVQEPS